MIKKLLLITGVLHSTYAWTDVRTDDETIQLECEETYWFQIDLVRNEHLAWKYDEPKNPLILKSIEIKPTEIKFVLEGVDKVYKNFEKICIFAHLDPRLFMDCLLYTSDAADE